MFVRCHRIDLTKIHPLTISRGTITGSTNVVIEIEHAGVVGLGEMAPSDLTGDTADSTEADVARWADLLAPAHPLERQRIEALMASAHDPARTASRMALDMALHDWMGRAANQPLWRLWGLDPGVIVPTSVTVGISPPDVIRARVADLIASTGARAIKVKLGGEGGIEADQERLVAADEARRAGSNDRPIALRVDANGGWSIDDARMMIGWLAQRGVEMVEQPIPPSLDGELWRLYADAPLPIFVDESIKSARDVIRVWPSVHGVNLKLMKCGSFDEALRIIHTARACRRQVMIGCMGESTLAISAGAQLSPLLDMVDLDSHLNLRDDPFAGAGATFVDGRIVPTGGPGLGVNLC